MARLGRLSHVVRTRAVTVTHGTHACSLGAAFFGPVPCAAPPRRPRPRTCASGAQRTDPDPTNVRTHVRRLGPKNKRAPWLIA